MSCVTEGNFFVTVNRAPDKPVLERKTSTALKVKQEFLNYQWLRYGQPIAGANSQLYNTTRSGLYSVLVSSKEGCSTESDAYGIGVNTDVKNANTQVGLKLYPNPALELITLSFNPIHEETHTIRIYDLSGAIIHERYVTSSGPTVSVTFDISEFSSGVYIIQINNHPALTTKFIKH
jgi:hypothetical protein